MKVKHKIYYFHSCVKLTSTIDMGVSLNVGEEQCHKVTTRIVRVNIPAHLSSW